MTKLLFLLTACGALGGCMATVVPAEDIQTTYLLPQTEIIAPAPVQYVHAVAPRPHHPRPLFANPARPRPLRPIISGPRGPVKPGNPGTVRPGNGNRPHNPGRIGPSRPGATRPGNTGHGGNNARAGGGRPGGSSGGGAARK